MRQIYLYASLVVLCLVSIAGAAVAEEKQLGWTDTAEFSFVATDGNSDSTSLGFKNVLARAWDKADLTIKLGGIRVETTTFDRFAVNGVVTELESSDVTAEAYYLNGRYDHKITDTFFWFTGAGWDRNEPSGIKNRYVVEGGLGNIWHDGDEVKFKTNYGITFTDQEDVVENPTVDDSFLGARGAWEYFHQFTDNTSFTNDFVVDLNLDESDDWRADMDNGLTVAMSEKLALKVGLRFLYDNMPSFTTITDYDLDPGDPAAMPIGELPFELEELDTILTISLVVNFK